MGAVGWGAGFRGRMLTADSRPSTCNMRYILPFMNRSGACAIAPGGEWGLLPLQCKPSNLLTGNSRLDTFRSLAKR